MGDSFQDAALVVLGHGTVLNEDSAAPVHQHVAELQRRGGFGEVRAAFWKQSPHVTTVLAELKFARIFIVPLFISEGYFASEVIPRELGFPATASPATTRTLERDGCRWHYCPPVGTHPRMTRIILNRAAEMATRHPFPRSPKPADTTLFIAGHGTERSARSRAAVERQAELIRAMNLYAEVEAVFMDDEPRIAGCQARAKGRHVIVVPFFISDGLHVVEDIPVLLGEPEPVVKARLATEQATWRNPTEHHGKLTWYSRAVGSEPGLIEVIMERVSEAVVLA
jgi:sirohydrochlorin cobaltochelatase